MWMMTGDSNYENWVLSRDVCEKIVDKVCREASGSLTFFTEKEESIFLTNVPASFKNSRKFQPSTISLQKRAEKFAFKISQEKKLLDGQYHFRKMKQREKKNQVQTKHQEQEQIRKLQLKMFRKIRAQNNIKYMKQKKKKGFLPRIKTTLDRYTQEDQQIYKAKDIQQFVMPNGLRTNKKSHPEKRKQFSVIKPLSTVKSKRSSLCQEIIRQDRKHLSYSIQKISGVKEQV